MTELFSRLPVVQLVPIEIRTMRRPFPSDHPGKFLRLDAASRKMPCSLSFGFRLCALSFWVMVQQSTALCLLLRDGEVWRTSSLSLHFLTLILIPPSGLSNSKLTSPYRSPQDVSNGSLGKPFSQQELIFEFGDTKKDARSKMCQPLFSPCVDKMESLCRRLKLWNFSALMK